MTQKEHNSRLQKIKDKNQKEVNSSGFSIAFTLFTCCLALHSEIIILAVICFSLFILLLILSYPTTLLIKYEKFYQNLLDKVNSKEIELVDVENKLHEESNRLLIDDLLENIFQKGA